MPNPMTAAELSASLRRTIDRELGSLRSLTELQSTAVLRHGGWNAKLELGHLIDSASNNHLRFVKAALEGGYSGSSYDQNGSVRLHAYDSLPWESLVEMWRHYNLLLAHLLGQLTPEQLDASCTVGTWGPDTLSALAADYLVHMRHHLDQLHSRQMVTQYPQA